jgi:hypothetical protein
MEKNVLEVQMSPKLEAALVEMSRTIAESQAETQRSLRELRANVDKVCAKVDKLGDFYGGVSENIGQHAEQFFQNALEKTRRFAGIKFKEFEPNLAYSGQKNCEFDVALINPDSIAIIETKNRVHHKFVEELATEKVAQFKKFSKKYGRLHIYLGVAGFSFDEEVLAEAKRYGVGVIRQVGNCARVDKGKLKVY